MNIQDYFPYKILNKILVLGESLLILQQDLYRRAIERDTKMTTNVIFYHNVSLNILPKMLMDATDTLTLQNQKNTVRKQSIQISHESIIREYSNIENAI